ncbi:hypothetical protein V8J36_04910 [Frigidibacter sp. MR17.14]|uniref:hypothetical protein n=1 Tax=Frigidibacter sp. MR17.14 TaxID=3126509 RepID=UPI003012A187
MSTGEAPRELIARLGQKMVDRLREGLAEPETDPRVTEAEQAIDWLSALLAVETEAAIEGRISELAETGPQKAEGLARVEAALAAIPELAEGLEGFPTLRPRLEALRTTAAQNAETLAGAAEAARMISVEIQRIRDRHSSAGVYGRNGQTRERPAPPGAEHIDREL